MTLRPDTAPQIPFSPPNTLSTMAAVIAYGGEGADDFATAVCVMHEYVFGALRDLKSITFPKFIFDLDVADLPELLEAYFKELYEHLTAFELYKASQVCRGNVSIRSPQTTHRHGPCPHTKHP